jgi:hypothetical protein
MNKENGERNSMENLLKQIHVQVVFTVLVKEGPDFQPYNQYVCTVVSSVLFHDPGSRLYNIKW